MTPDQAAAELTVAVTPIPANIRATEPPADLVLAWITARPYDELGAWRALYDARYPRPQAACLASDLARAA